MWCKLCGVNYVVQAVLKKSARIASRAPQIATGAPQESRLRAPTRWLRLRPPVSFTGGLRYCQKKAQE
eukprot:6365563-Pyramimonas_sp.AAC.1